MQNLGWKGGEVRSKGWHLFINAKNIGITNFHIKTTRDAMKWAQAEVATAYGAKKEDVELDEAKVYPSDTFRGMLSYQAMKMLSKRGGNKGKDEIVKKLIDMGATKEEAEYYYKRASSHIGGSKSGGSKSESIISMRDELLGEDVSLEEGSKTRRKRITRKDIKIGEIKDSPSLKSWLKPGFYLFCDFGYPFFTRYWGRSGWMDHKSKAFIYKTREDVEKAVNDALEAAKSLIGQK